MKRLSFKSRYKTELIDITSAINETIIKSGKSTGAVNIFTPHSTCSVFVLENRDPNVQRDLLKKLHQLFPNDDQYAHIGKNGDAHLKTAVTGASITIPVESAKMSLGAWQGVFLADFNGPRERDVLVTLFDA
ncbi:MAG: secondary thiamine-phosphate synthase enzyme YjbQ [Helicobacteraceae bacterium]|jgi:secondary thiamine-phosphate synthase enzyme|nr:secondary thiamine-phosphate synthase enzyme YjbQ [Helicobacteraceae bacterium]